MKLERKKFVVTTSFPLSCGGLLKVGDTFTMDVPIYTRFERFRRALGLWRINPYLKNLVRAWLDAIKALAGKDPHEHCDQDY